MARSRVLEAFDTVCPNRPPALARPRRVCDRGAVPIPGYDISAEATDRTFLDAIGNGAYHSGHSGVIAAVVRRRHGPNNSNPKLIGFARSWCGRARPDQQLVVGFAQQRNSVLRVRDVREWLDHPIRKPLLRAIRPQHGRAAVCGERKVERTEVRV